MLIPVPVIIVTPYILDYSHSTRTDHTQPAELDRIIERLGDSLNQLWYTKVFVLDVAARHRVQFQMPGYESVSLLKSAGYDQN
ncbi:hypothetical protein GBC03_01810 (plasmid) [Citrobacter telavivensis]|uniref:Uncharacterized protein n=1 Tax=Citrobacter telavivensis TaxID=2653932 RepID=A0A6L5EI28_9ENTR|nr:hypothetical protein [Citrobacter telavivensis]QFS69025.1 hypothetical protein GBC03_01810 [Citrobacter telavivensis]